jgi:hypothetical protein
MADRNNARPPSPVGMPAPAAGARAPSLQIDSLRVRIPGNDRAAGQDFARELSGRLAALAPSLLAAGAGRSLELGTLQLSLPATKDGHHVGAASDAIENAILRALRSAQRGSGGAG